MFKENKYSRTYYNIINRAKSRVIPKEIYTEAHHIIPKSLGGTDDRSNIAVLTAREHYICHLLLPKMTQGPAYHKMIRAHVIMSGRKIYGSRVYASYREEYSKIAGKPGPLNPMWGVDRSGEKNTFYGRKHSIETKMKISEGQKRRKKDRPETFKSYNRTDEHKQAASNRAKARAAKYTFEHPDHGRFYGTTGDLATAYQFSKTSEAYKLAKGIYKTYKGWKLVKL